MKLRKAKHRTYDRISHDHHYKWHPERFEWLYSISQYGLGLDIYAKDILASIKEDQRNEEHILRQEYEKLSKDGC